MKIVILGAEARYRAYQPAMPFIQQQELVFLDKDSTEAEILAAGADAECCSWTPSRWCPLL